MHTTIRTALMLLLPTALTAMLMACDPPEDRAARKLLKDNCRKCHTLARVESQRLTREQWRKIVIRMTDGSSINMTDEEKEMLIDYLSKTYKKEK